MFNKKNDPLIESVKGVMEQNELHRRVEAAVNEHFGIESRSALPHEHHAEYDAVLAEAKKCSIEEGEVIDFTKEKAKKKRKKDDDGLNESEHKPDSPDHHRAMAIRAHKAMKAGDKSEITANKKKRHEKAYKEMTGSKIKYPDSMNEENDEGSTPRNAKERALAKLHGNPKKITHGDVLKGRGVVEESDQLDEKATESQKNKVGNIMGEFKRGELHSGSKKGPVVKNRKQAIAIALKQAGLSNNKLEEEMDIDLIMEEIYTNLLEELNYVYENYDEASFADYVNSLSEEQLEVLGLLDEEVNSSPWTEINKRSREVSASSKAPDYSKAPDTSSMNVPKREFAGAEAAKRGATSSTTNNPLPRKGGIFGFGSREDTTGTGADTNAPSSIPRSTTAGDYKSGSGEKPSASHLAGGTKAPSSTTDTKPSILSPGAKPFTPPTPESARGLPSPTGASRFGKGGPGGARASSKATPAGARIAADVAKARGETPTPAAVSAAKNVRTGTPSTRPGAAKPAARPGAARPAAKPAARPGAPAARRVAKSQGNAGGYGSGGKAYGGSTGGLSTHGVWGEETEKPQIKESFEQFLRNRFLKG